MFLIALLLGVIASISPFIGLVLVITYCHYLLKNELKSPLNRLMLFFVFPILFVMLFANQTGSLVVASDAVFGVGLVAVVFLFGLIKHKNSTQAMANGALLIIAYGIIRHFLFGDYLMAANEQALSDMGNLFPRVMQNAELQNSLSLMHYFIPSSWMVPQLVALFTGFVIFRNLGERKFVWKKFSLPYFYNFLFIILLPLYFIPQLRMIFVNTLLAVCVLPLIQGIGVILHFFARLSNNVIFMILLSILILFNLILVALLGFADTWLDLRKLKTKGIKI